MSLVPSHDCLLLKETTSKTCLSSVRVDSQTGQALAFVGLLTPRFLIFSCCTIHLRARWDQPDDPSARTTGRYL